MGYALFAQRKLVLDGQLNALQLQQTQRSNEQYNLATQTLSLQQQMASMQAAQSSQLAEKYEELSHVGQIQNADGSWEKDSSISDNDYKTKRDDINDEIKKLEAKFEAELDGINRDIYKVSVKENILEMQVKRLDTMVSAVEKQLEAVEKAEEGAIDRATPNFSAQG